MTTERHRSLPDLLESEINAWVRRNFRYLSPSFIFRGDFGNITTVLHRSTLYLRNCFTEIVIVDPVVYWARARILRNDRGDVAYLLDYALKVKFGLTPGTINENDALQAYDADRSYFLNFSWKTSGVPRTNSQNDAVEIHFGRTPTTSETDVRRVFGATNNPRMNNFGLVEIDEPFPLSMVDAPSGGGKHAYKGRSYRIRVGEKGGRYILANGKKIYVK